MKKFILMLSAIALFVSCSDDSEQDPTVDDGLYVTSSSGEQLISGASVTYYQGDNTLVVDGFAYTASLVAMGGTTTLPIAGVTESVDGDITTLTGDGIAIEYTYMTLDATGEISDLTCVISGGRCLMEFSISASEGGSGTDSEYPCRYVGDIMVEEGSYGAAFTLAHDAGFNITISSGVTSEITDVTVAYYQGDNTLVIDGFKFSTSIPMGTTLAIDGLSESATANGLTTITGDGIEISYTVMYQPCTSDVTDLTCEIIDEVAQLEFWIMYNDYNYPCTYNGDVTIYEESYATVE